MIYHFLHRFCNSFFSHINQISRFSKWLHQSNINWQSGQILSRYRNGVCKCLRACSLKIVETLKNKKTNGKTNVNHLQLKDLMTIAARHLTSDNIRILFPLVELLLLLTREQGSKTLIILASKIIFKLSKDDANDNAFLSRRVLDLLLTGASWAFHTSCIDFTCNRSRV